MKVSKTMTDEQARLYFERRAWPFRKTCPWCGGTNRIDPLGSGGSRGPGFYRCRRCRVDFTVRTGTVMKRSKIPLSQWLATLRIIAERGYPTATSLKEELGITHKSALFLLRRIRSACGRFQDGDVDFLADRVLRRR